MMQYLKAILKMNKLRLIILVAIQVLSDKEKGGVKGKILLDYLVKDMEFQERIIQDTILSMIRQNLLVVENNNIIKLNYTTTKYFQLLTYDACFILLNNLKYKNISFRSFRLYLLMKMKAYPKKSGLRYSYRQMLEDYKKYYNSEIDLEEIDIFNLVKELEDNNIISRKKYEDEMDNRYTYNEYKFVSDKEMIENMF